MSKPTERVGVDRPVAAIRGFAAEMSTPDPVWESSDGLSYAEGKVYEAVPGDHWPSMISIDAIDLSSLCVTDARALAAWINGLAEVGERSERHARCTERSTMTYHPDAAINAEVATLALESERIDLAAGYPPRRWTCPCGASHGRGHFQTIGVHRCLACGYVGDGGIMATPEDGDCG